MEFHGGHYTGMEPLKIITRIKMLSFSLCCLTSCVGLTTAFDRTFHEVIIYNDSPNNISICFNIDSIGNQKGQFYSEDRLPNSSMFITAIAPNSKCRQEVWRGSWDSFFSRYKQLSVFIFDNDTLTNKIWRTIVAENNYLIRYDFSQDMIYNMEERDDNGKVISIIYHPSDNTSNYLE